MILAVALSGLAGATISALVTYMLGRRKMSGTVETAEAATLFAESTQMRHDLRDDLVQTRGDLSQIRAELGVVRGELVVVRSDLAITRADLLRLKDEHRDCMKEISRLKAAAGER